MPRTILERQKPDSKLMMLILGKAAVRKLNKTQLAQMAGCSANTMYSRAENPDSMTLGELLGVAKGMDIPIDELRQAITY